MARRVLNLRLTFTLVSRYSSSFFVFAPLSRRPQPQGGPSPWYLRLQCVLSLSSSPHQDRTPPELDVSHRLPDFEKPSAIQQRAILPITKGRDVIAQAQSGTGKTATFSISILQSIDTSIRDTQALVLSPTRELATQIQSVVLALGDYMNVQCHACIGGTSIGEDIKKLDYGQHVVSGTPGRVFDMIRRRNLRTRNIKVGDPFACMVGRGTSY